ncbi:MAG: hypothetical protein WCG10_01065 [Chlamydiota bacterium]
MPSNIAPATHPLHAPLTLPHVTESNSIIIEIFNSCLHSPDFINTQTLIEPQALQKAHRYYILKEAMLAASDEADYAIGSESSQHLVFLNHYAKEITPIIQDVLTNSDLINYLQTHQIRPLL